MKMAKPERSPLYPKILFGFTEHPITVWAGVVLLRLYFERNIYLHPLDRQMKQQGYRMVRYADDFVVLCRTAGQAQGALEEVKSWVKQNGLRLNADKTHVGGLSASRARI